MTLEDGASSQPRVGLVIVMFNALEHWPRLRAALAAQRYKSFQAIVIDNASGPDARLSDADMPDGFRLVQLPENVGYAAANNRAAALLNMEFLAFLNPDAFPEPEWLENLVAAADRNPEAAAFGSTMLRDGELGYFDGVGDSYWAGGAPFRGGQGRQRQFLHPEGEVFSAPSVAALFRRQTFSDLGGFDERFFAVWVDVDFGFRLRLAGGSAVQTPDAVVRHISGSTIGRRSAFRTYHAFRNRMWIFVKNMPALFFWAGLPAHAAMTGLDLLLVSMRGGWKEAWLGLKHGWKDLPAMIETRRTLQAQRKVSLRALAKAMVWSPVDPFLRRPKIWRDDAPAVQKPAIT